MDIKIRAKMLQPFSPSQYQDPEDSSLHARSRAAYQSARKSTNLHASELRTVMRLSLTAASVPSSPSTQVQVSVPRLPIRDKRLEIGVQNSLSCITPGRPEDPEAWLQIVLGHVLDPQTGVGHFIAQRRYSFSTPVSRPPYCCSPQSQNA
ncbi:hypothetical protein E2P81_ATG00540 [Venturia nashicola]|nr:hypothetical protein E2P81_ATG00540 [Venturia nashicola]